ncbi:CBO0543 family protein [Aquibacillus rhizosphaerae]|uniref:CBO0543 family protein n=1 Tax=Aquibacillus rhizosphaerae TaxID=3051431 RepID=A0ABT7L3K0_9BACI|nr:CBO0543 family protein [Aquibacillus sp. LR5S19]MDL4840443.1 CBO0543 family protein [Aquibacillus sp. LR5S19]
MHIGLALLMILSVWLRGDWRNWQKYHTVMLYYAIGNLTYNFLTANYFLWRMDGDFISNHTLTEMIYTFIIFPGTALLFICNYPSDLRKIIKHYLFWIGLYVGVEAFMTITGHIDYQYGWNLVWSAAFDCIMFPMMRLFYKRPLLAYFISIFIAIFFLWYYKVPVHLPVEER